MSHYQFTLTLDESQMRAPEVRLWIDDQLAGDLSSERELTLVRETESSWSALFSASDDAFMYRVGICAAPGCRWTLSFKDAAHDDGSELLYDSDELMMAKEWLVGTCEPALVESHLRLHRSETQGAFS